MMTKQQQGSFTNKEAGVQYANIGLHRLLIRHDHFPSYYSTTSNSLNTLYHFCGFPINDILIIPLSLSPFSRFLLGRPVREVVPSQFIRYHPSCWDIIPLLIVQILLLQQLSVEEEEVNQQQQQFYIICFHLFWGCQLVVFTFLHPFRETSTQWNM